MFLYFLQDDEVLNKGMILSQSVPNYSGNTPTAPKSSDVTNSVIIVGTLLLESKYEFRDRRDSLERSSQE